jgi:outer membrane protein
MSKKALFVLLALGPPLFAAPIHAVAAEEPLSLTQALQRAVAANVELRKERIAFEIAGAGLMAAQGAFDFVLGANLNFSRTTQPPLTAEDISGGHDSTLALGLNLTRPLESGGLVRLSARALRSDTSQRNQCGLDQADCIFYNGTLDLTFNHPLLRGFGTEIAQANVRRQRIQADLALLNRQMRAANVIRDVINAYWELAYATQLLAIRRSAVEQAREQLRITKAQIDVGRLAPIDQAAVERAIGERLQEVAVAEQDLFFRTLDLRRLMGVPGQPGQPPFAAVDAPTATPRQVDANAEVRRALESNPQLRSLRMGLRLSEIDIQTAHQTLKPRLDFVGTIGSRGRDPGLGQTLFQTAGLDELTWSTGLTLEIPLENRVARGQSRAAELQGQSAHLDAALLELTIRDTAMRLSSNIHTASRRVELAKQTVGFAQQNLEAERARFSVGRSTNNDVLLRQQELKAAEIQVVRATVDLLNSEADLSAITAEILERHGVVLRGS